ncbi:MAG: riboflavin biosynthesis protein RibF [Legionella sp. 21-45-4]|nr:MAG: riboflavin biosynthesis protein RibF [Legionella sp. 21-45-4]
MKVLRGLRRFLALQQGAVVTIGNFDGVHTGHQALLSDLKSLAARTHLPTLVVFFEPQPAEYFKREGAASRLMTRREKFEYLATCGIDYAYCLPFNPKLAAMSAEQFATCFVFALFQAKYVLIGHDFRFGRDRAGHPELLQELGAPLASVTVIYPDFKDELGRVSSTRIRQALSLGHLEEALRGLGRPFSISGRVVAGEGRGREWGVPTANLHTGQRVLPLRGVYCVRVVLPNQDTYWGVANVGTRPTLNGDRARVEVHLFDFSGDLYQMRLQVLFLKRLRDEQKFASLDALIEQIEHDVVLAKAFATQQVAH